MNKNQIIQEVYFDNFYQAYISSEVPNLQDEAKSEFINMLFDVKENTLIDLHKNGCLRFYCIKIIRNMVANRKSPFNKMYREQHTDIDTLNNLQDDVILDLLQVQEDKTNDRQDLINEIFSFLDQRKAVGSWYDNAVFKKYYIEGLSFRQMARETGIHYVSLFKTISLVKEMINTKFKTRYNDL